jgi:nucleoside-diphosphate-sugar epimerase
MLHVIMSGPTSEHPPYYVADVRDVAKAHVLALDLPRNPGALERRYIVNSGNTTWRKITDHLKITHPELKFLPSSEYPDTPGPDVIFDTSSTIAELKFGKFIDTMQTIDDAVVALQEVEKTWA